LSLMYPVRHPGRRSRGRCAESPHPTGRKSCALGRCLA